MRAKSLQISPYAKLIATSFEKKYDPKTDLSHKTKASNMNQGIRIVYKNYDKLKEHPLEVKNQIFDRFMLYSYPLYLKSRQLAIENDCKFEHIHSDIAFQLIENTLLTKRIQIVPLENECRWAAFDLQYKNSLHIMHVLHNISSVFHEQNHRILWSLLPKCSQGGRALKNYLNFAESMTMTLDYALAHKIQPKMAWFLQLIGVSYRGAHFRKHSNDKKNYSDFLVAFCIGQLMYFDFYKKRDVKKFLKEKFPNQADIISDAVDMAFTIESEFNTETNHQWQMKYKKDCEKFLVRKSKNTLNLSNIEKSFDELKIIIEKILKTYEITK